MEKEYRLFYGITRTQLDETAKHIGRLLGMSVTLRTGSYSGDYATYDGPAADYVSIRPRNRNDFPAGVDYKKFSIQLLACNTVGKNSEKETRHINLKDKLDKLPGFFLITETVTESKQ